MRIKSSVQLLSLITLFNVSIHSHVLADNLQDAEQAISKQEYSTAVIHLKNQLKKTPKNAQARYLLGDVYLRTGKLDASIKELGRAHEYAPDNTAILFRYSEVLQASGKQKKVIKLLKPLKFTDKTQESQRLSYLGYSHLELKQLADAKQLFNEANQLQESALAYNGLVNLAMLEKDLPLAEQQLSKSLKVEPDNALTLQLKAKLANLNQQHEEALTIYNQLIKKNNTSISLRLERAATLAILNKDDEAKADLKFVLGKVKNHPQANFILAQILLRERDFAGAQEAAQQVVNFAPQHMPAALTLGAANFALKHYNQAEEYLTIYLASNPSNLKAQNLLANVYLTQGKTKQALLILEGIPEEQRNKDPMILMTLGSAYVVKGDTIKGVKNLTMAQSLAPDNIDIKKRLIAAQFKSGNMDDAVSELEELSKSDGVKGRTNYLLIISYIKQKEFDKAYEKTSQLLTKTPEDTKLQNLKALIEQLKGNTEQSIAQYQTIIKQDNKNIPAYMGLARIATIQSKWQEAEKYFQQVIDINPKAVKAYLGLVAIAEKQGNAKAAEQYFLDAIEQSKSNIPTQLTIANLLSQWYSKKQQPEKVLALAEKLNKQHPNDNSIRSFLAKAQLLNKQNAQAEKTLNSIINFNKNDVTHRILLANIIMQEPKRSSEALSLLKDAQAVAPDNMNAYAMEVAILIKLTRYEEAIDVARSMQIQFPESTAGQLLEADIFRAQKKYKRALPLYQQAYQQQPDKKVLAATINVLLALKQTDDAIALLTQAVDKNPNDTESIFKLASLYHEQQKLKQAEQYYKQLLKILPNNVISLNNLAWIYIESDVNKAVKLAKRAYEQAPKSAAIADTYGYFLVRDGQHKDGLTILEKAAAELPEDNDIQYHLAVAYEKTGQKNKSVDILKKIINSASTFSELDNAKQLLQKLK